MILKGIIFEDFVNYKKPSMVLEFPYCDFKCDKECGEAMCQNSALINEPDIEVPIDEIIQQYIGNPITEAIVCQGLEPVKSWGDVVFLIESLRNKYTCHDDFVIYTGFTEKELTDSKLVEDVKKFDNVIIKYGRFKPYQKIHYDNVLGVNLASDNQYAVKIS